MSSTPFSYRQYPGNGTTTVFSVPFPYLLKAHVKVFLGYNLLDGTFSAQLLDGADFNWTSATQIQLTTAPTAGQAVTVIRQTPTETQVVGWQDGSSLIADDLDTADKQNLYVVQEQADRTALAVAAASDALSELTDLTTYGENYLGALASDPAAKPGGGDIQEGNFYYNTTTNRFRVYGESTWSDGAAPTTLFRWKKVATGGETSLSGDDDNAQALVYTADFEQVYVNGTLLVRGVEYTAINGTSITGLTALTAGDVVEVISFNAFTIGVAPTEVDFTGLTAANQPIDDSDLFLLRQGTTNKKVTASVFRTELAAGAEAAQAQAETAVVNAQTAQAAAELAETGALGAKAGAEAARDSAIIQAGLYPDEATGRAAVADGEAFKVQGNADIAAFEYRRINASTSTLIATYPSSGYVYSLRYDIGEHGLTKYKGSGPTYPIVIDQANRVVLGYDTATGNLDGVGLINLDNLYDKVTADVIAPLSVGNYTGSGPVYPIVIDRGNRVVLGYDTESNLLVGPGIGQTSQAAVVSTSNRVPLASPPIEKAVNHIIFYGQSLSVGAAGGAIVSTTQPYNNITFNGGPRAYTGTAFDFSAFKPLVEDATRAPDGNTNRTETPCSGAANYATTLSVTEAGRTPASHVILASTAGKGGARIDELKKGTAWYTNTFLPHINGARSLNANYAVHAFGWVQGENDSTPGRQTPYAAYRADLNQLQIDIENDVKAITGQTSPVYCLTYQTVGDARTWKDQCLAQLNLAQTNSKFFLATPIYHLPHAGDAVHLTSTGYKWMGAYFGRAYKNLVIDGLEPQWLNPVSAYTRGNVVTVRFDVPVKPLVIDTTTLAVTTDKGFKVLDGATAAAISSIEAQDDKVVITLESAPAGAVTVRYALDYLGAGLNITGGASGNLRDSNPETITISGVARPLYNVCPHFEMAAITLGE